MTGARRSRNIVFTFLCIAATTIGVVMLVVLLWSVFKQGMPRIRADFFTSFPSRFPEKAGILSALMGSLWIIALTGLISVPVGVAAAIYLEEFTSRKNRWTEFIQLNISNLAGVPSIVYGLLGLAVFVRWLDLGRSILAGALTMSLLILPTVIIVSQEALRAVPKSYREGSFALGATQWQTISKQVLPSASAGIFTGIILAISRAIGESAPLIVVGAVAYVARVPKGPGDAFTVLPIQIYNWISEAKEGFHVAAAAAIIVLMAVLIAMNAVAIWLRNRAQSRA